MLDAFFSVFVIFHIQRISCGVLSFLSFFLFFFVFLFKFVPLKKCTCTVQLYSLSKLLALVRISLASLHVCFAAASRAECGFP